MELSDTQKATITQWIQDGRSLAEVQRLIREEFELPMTYMDVRFLIDDLDITMAEPEAEEKAKDAPADDAATEASDPEIVDDGGSGSVSVDVDAVMRPGSLVSGTVRFSDGVSLGWQLSASGQLGLIPGDDPDYRPDPEDVQAFQTQLEEVLRQKGF
ncbi:MAG: hypothetical protein GVY36_15170 [Verrucomicrobia bacterium]|jgi:hypothetical protein|nr:hypothetical protein [Verrucomicrobiota bacterium]